MAHWHAKFSRKILTAALVGGTAAGLFGCAPMLIATGAAAGYAISRDSMVFMLEKPWMEIWQASLDEVKAQGLLKQEDVRRGRISALVQDADVSITLKQLTPSTVRVTVRARKNLLPKIDIAQALALAISKRVERGGPSSASGDIN